MGEAEGRMRATKPPSRQERDCCVGARRGLRRSGGRAHAITLHLSWRLGGLAALALAIGVAACAGASSNKCTASAAPSPAAQSAAALSASASPFDVLRGRILDELLADDPSTARDLGLHQYDGKVASLSAEAIAARRMRLERAA